jgi:hypothetical protein
MATADRQPTSLRTIAATFVFLFAGYQSCQLKKARRKRMHAKAVRTCTQSQRDPCTQAAHPHNGISAPNLVWSPQMRGLAPNLNVIRAPDNQDCTLRFRQDAHGSTFPCFFKILFFFKGFSKSCDKFTTQMYLGVICTGPYAHGSTFQTTNMPTCTRSPHTISRRVHMSKCSTYFASHISPWSRCHLLAWNNAAFLFGTVRGSPFECL